MRKRICCFVAIIIIASLAQGHAKRGPSTPEERQRLLLLVQKMEESPLDDSLRPEIRWALEWLIEVPDISVSICSAPFGKFLDAKYKYAPDYFVSVFTFAMARFIIQNSDKAGDKVAQYTAGVESVLNSYKSILKIKPEAHSKDLDDLLQKQGEGKLAEFVRESSQAKCK